MASYQDIPLPKRTEQQEIYGEQKAAVPEHFRLELTLDSHNKCLNLYAFLNETSAFYRGRGYFTECSSDLPQMGFRVAVVGLLDPFLSKASTIEAKHFPIILRVVVPKLCKDGVSLKCELQISEELPVIFHVQWEEKAQAVSLCVVDSVPRASLEVCPNLESYRLSGNTLYRLNHMQMQALESYPAGEKLLTVAEWEQLCRFQEHFPQFFKATEMLQVKCQLREQQQEQKNASENIASLTDSVFLGIPAPVPSKKKPPSAEALRPIVSRKAEIVQLPAPLLESAELVVSGGNQMYASRTALFLHDAQRLKNYQVKNAHFMPFRTGRPTYSDMNPTQRGWYFFWRSEFNSGILQKTDIAYLYIAIYELLNQVTASGAEALSKLLRLWESYRGDFPYLDLCMPGWCVDFMLVNHLGTDFDVIHERIPFHLNDCGVPAELFLNRRLQDGLSKLPLALLSRFSEYDVCSSRFCETEANLKNVDELVHKALEVAEQASLEQGTPLLASFHVRKTEYFRESYYGAMVDRAGIRRITLKYLPLISNLDFQTMLAGILRACENALRRRERFPGRLKEEKLPTYLADALAPLLEKASQRPTEPKKSKKSAPTECPPQKPLVIDLSRARDLEEQSWENTRKLLDALGEDAAETTENAESAETVKATESAEEQSEILPPKKSDATENTAVPSVQEEIFSPNTEFSPENGIFAALSETAAAVLKALATGNAAEVHKICTEHMTFPEAVYEEINEAALEVIGDLLLDTATGEIFEDYQEIICTELENA